MINMGFSYQSGTLVASRPSL